MTTKPTREEAGRKAQILIHQEDDTLLPGYDYKPVAQALLDAYEREDVVRAAFIEHQAVVESEIEKINKELQALLHPKEPE